MLEIMRQASPAACRLVVRNVPAQAWVAKKPWRYGGTDWELWIIRDGMPVRATGQLQLEIQSRLRAWPLRRYHLRLLTLSFDELLRVAEGAGKRVAREHPRARGNGFL
jgi:hypothetical protein